MSAWIYAGKVATNEKTVVHVVLMTGHGDIPMSVRAMKAGAVDFLPKPFREQDMIDAVSIAIERDRERVIPFVAKRLEGQMEIALRRCVLEA